MPYRTIKPVSKTGFNLTLDVSETDGNIIHVGAVNHWVSEDEGYTWTCPAAWFDSGFQNYVHADIHDMHYYGQELWISCDGGIFYSADKGATFERRMFGIAGTDFWGFGTGFLDGDVMVGGTYHNGTLLKDNDVYNNGWLSTDGGDNIRGYVNYGNPRMIYTDYGGHYLSGDSDIPNSNFGFDSLPNAIS